MMVYLEQCMNIAMHLDENIVEETFNLVIRRSHVVSDALKRINKAANYPRKRLHVINNIIINGIFSD